MRFDHDRISIALLLVALPSCMGLQTHRKVSSRAYTIFSTEGVEKAEKLADTLLSEARSELNKSLSALERAFVQADAGALQQRGLLEMDESASDDETVGAGDTVHDGPRSPFLPRDRQIPSIGATWSEIRRLNPESLRQVAVQIEMDTAGQEAGLQEVADSAHDLYEAASNFETVDVRRRLSRGAATEIREAIDSKASYLVSSEPFFSVGAVVAFDNDLDATSIPTVAYNFYPFDGKDFDTLGMQLVFGGALSSTGSGGSGDTDIGLAVGGGFFLPVGASGSIAFGHMLWDEEGNGENGWYIGINIGARAQSTSLSQ